MDASPENKATTSTGESGVVVGFLGTIISLPGLTFGLVLKNKNLRVPFTVPLE